ncbi:hypothetical protein [Paenibacillus sp. 1781tsa1]|uniref:hypothetical protein n=1 Tax=Paenibacillus sp. 1781tsa1 TaxID=2953810 RepID=UPI00209CC2D5|nr:hypothetical protein [Paenibacillus sp. 1781tsa1]MCP1184974.1 hypothetical protein [Paenibacillus sp. 1781tsa1]
MNSMDFEARKGNLRTYFLSDKFKENELGERVYYKGKRNLKELKYILDLVFGDDYEIINETYLQNSLSKEIGGYITCKMYVDADFNGFNQGAAGDNVFARFNLTENAFYMEQAQTIEGLDRNW